MTNPVERKLTLDIKEALDLFGHYDENLRLLEDAFRVKIIARGDEIVITGEEEETEKALEVFQQLLEHSRAGNVIGTREVNYAINLVRRGSGENIKDLVNDTIVTTFKGKQIKPKTHGQRKYLHAINKNDIVFGIGPAGTGKTYLAVAAAAEALRNKDVNRLILTRPAVEAGEKLGFLPGDLQEKVNPYLRPLYDSLYDILGIEKTQKFLERNIIEIAPLAYMRGRTLDDSFIILDEAQNTTPEQMKMFLTRMGFGSKAVITGDITQVDLPKGQVSGLAEAQKILKGIKGLEMIYFTEEDVMRHPLVQKIIESYAQYEESR